MTDKRIDRLHRVEVKPLSHDSLVGSFFHSDHTRGWQGCVVAEPHPGIYLVELFEWIVGSSSTQKLVRFEDMADWQFYDTAEWMTNEYTHGGLAERWKQLREPKA
jgi:hypothetical protein